MLLTGDSVSWSLGWTVRPDDLDAAMTLDNRAIIGCGAMPSDAQWLVVGRAPQPYGKCERQAEADRLGLEGSPDVVLLWVGAWEVFDHEWKGTRYEVGTEEAVELVERQLQRRLDVYEASGVPTVMSLLGCFGEGADWLGNDRLDPERIQWVNERIRAVAARNRTWVRLIDPTTVLCDEQGNSRTFTTEGDELRPDGAHFEDASSAWFWNAWLAGQLGAALESSG